MSSIIASRPMNFFERVTANVSPCFINLAIDIEDPKIIPDYLEIIKRNSPPFYMKADKVFLYRFKDAEFPIHHIPETITNLQDSIEWTLQNCPATGSDPLATVSVNSHKIVLNYCHSFFSGAMFLHIINEIQNPSNLSIPTFPLRYEDTHPIHDVSPISYHYQLPHLTHYINKRVMIPDQTNIFQLINSQYDITKLPCSKYDSTTKNYKVKEITEYLATCYILAVKAINMKNGFSNYDDGWGTGTAYDIRRSLPIGKCGLKALNLVGNMFMFSKHKPNTVGELMTNLRNELKNSIDNQLWLNHFKWAFMNQVEERPRLGLILFMTNGGQARIKYPIKDIMMWFSNDYPEDVLYLLTYSVIKEKKNTLKTSLIYGRSEIHKKEVLQIDKTLHFAINHLKKSDKINDALIELINFNS